MGWFRRSPWILHYNATSCNGCDIELIASMTPLYDLERFGAMVTGNPKHADILAVTGSVNEKSRQVVLNLYDQMPNPKVVMAVGICAISGCVFQDCYNVLGGVDKVLPVDVYVPGCAARPEAIIDGLLRACELLDGKHAEQKRSGRTAGVQMRSGENP